MSSMPITPNPGELAVSLVAVAAVVALVMVLAVVLQRRLRNSRAAGRDVAAPHHVQDGERWHGYGRGGDGTSGGH